MHACSWLVCLALPFYLVTKLLRRAHPLCLSIMQCLVEVVRTGMNHVRVMTTILMGQLLHMVSLWLFTPTYSIVINLYTSGPNYHMPLSTIGYHNYV